MTQTKEVAVKAPSEFALFNNKELDIISLIEDNLGDEDFSPQDLDRIKVPAGGGTSFEIPGPDGEETVKQIEALVVAIKKGRAYWSQELTGEGTPPDCISTNSSIGNGDPGGTCSECPFNQFGSANQGAGKACKEMRSVFILPGNAMLPFVLQVPPTSIKPLKKYITGLTRYGKSIYEVMIKISLEKTKSKGGITYSLIKFEHGQSLSAEQITQLKDYRQAFIHSFDQAHEANLSSGPAFSEKAV